MFTLNSRFLSFNSQFKLKCWKKLWFEDLFRTLFVRIFKNRLVCLSTQHQGPSFQITNSAPSPNTEFHIIKYLSYFLVHVSKSTSIYQHRCTKRNPSITFFISTSIFSLKILNIIQPSIFVLFFVFQNHLQISTLTPITKLNSLTKSQDFISLRSHNTKWQCF